MLRELRPGLVTWVSRLNKYIRLYGLKFPRADHITLIKTLMSFITSPGDGLIFNIWRIFKDFFRFGTVCG